MEAKAQAFDAVEEAVALERACSALELLSLASRDAPWVQEIALRSRFGTGHGAALHLSIVPSLGEEREREAMLAGLPANLPAMIDFAIAASKITHGTVQKEDLPSTRALGDAMRSTFWLASRQDGFCGSSAATLKSRLAFAERELAKAMSWAQRSGAEWMRGPAPDAGHWEQKASRPRMDSGESLARFLGWTELATRIEHRALANACSDPLTERQRRAL